MKRCDFCGGRFGLVSHRHLRKRFCRKRCKENYFADRVQKIDSHRRQPVARPRQVELKHAGRS